MKHKRFFSAFFILLIVTSIGFIFFQGAKTIFPLLGNNGQLKKVDKFTFETQDDRGTIKLPKIIKPVAPHSKYVFFSEIDASAGDSVLIKSVFTHARLYVDDVLVYEFGEKGDFPSFMNDPPTMLKILPLPESKLPQQLRMELMSPSQRDEMSVPALFIGSEGALLFKLAHENGFSLLFSILLFSIGLFVVCAAAVILRKTKDSLIFVCLGIFSICTGVWVFGECDLSLFLLPHPSLLYAFAYLGLFSLVIPLSHFGLMTFRPKNRWPLTLMLGIHYVSLSAAILLQLLGIVDLMKSLYWFHIISPLGFVVFSGDLLWESIRHKNRMAQRFAPAIILLTLSVVLELCNYWLHFAGTYTSLFQLGLLAFVLSLGLISGQYIRTSLHMAEEKRKLEYEMTAMEHQIALQRDQYEKMMKNSEAVKMMRHDMRHHLSVLNRMIGENQADTAKTYIHDLENTLAAVQEKNYCKNYTVNAVLAHYLGIAEGGGISVDVKLDFPTDTGILSAMDLCIIMGNYLENALEACQKMDRDPRFIRVRSRVSGDTLSMVVSNSFDGVWQEENDVYLSRKEKKKNQVGIGLSSVEQVCKKYQGMTNYQIAGNTWKSSALVHMTKIAAFEEEQY